MTLWWARALFIHSLVRSTSCPVSAAWWAGAPGHCPWHHCTPPLVFLSCTVAPGLGAHKVNLAIGFSSYLGRGPQSAFRLPACAIGLNVSPLPLIPPLSGWTVNPAEGTVNCRKLDFVGGSMVRTGSLSLPCRSPEGSHPCSQTVIVYESL